MLSRVADNLYWMSRYLERAQHTARLLDASLTFMLDQSPELIEQRWLRTLNSLHVFPDELANTLDPHIDSYALAYQLTFDAGNEISIFSCVHAARENARQVREEISGEMWECLNRLYLGVRAACPPPTASPSAAAAQSSLRMDESVTGMRQSTRKGNDAFWRQPHEFFVDVQRKAFEFEGATDATMQHSEGWLFIQVGRGLEQAVKTAALLDSYFAQAEPDVSLTNKLHEGNVKWTALLKSCAAFEPYCRIYSPRLAPEKIADFLLLDEDFPRSVRAAVDRVEAALHGIAQITGKDYPHPNGQFSGAVIDESSQRLARLAGRLRATLDFASLDEVMASGLPRFLREVREDCVRIHSAIYHVYIGYLAE